MRVLTQGLVALARVFGAPEQGYGALARGYGVLRDLTRGFGAVA